MKRKAPLVMCAASLMLLMPIAAGSADWTLDRTINSAVAASNRLASEELEARLARIDARTAHLSWRPSVSFQSSASVVSEVMEIDMPFTTIRFGDYDAYHLSLSVQQLIYDGGKLNALENASKIRARMNEHQAGAVRLEVEYRAKTAFYGVVRAERMASAAEQSVIQAKRHLQDVESRVRQGLALENDIIRSKLRITQAEMELASRTAELETARGVFREITGIPPEETVTVSLNDSGGARVENASVERALALRPEMKAFSAAIDVSENIAKAAGSDALPTVGFYGSFNYGKPGLDLPANDWMHYASGGIRLSWNVWDWGRTGREAEKAKINGTMAERRRNDFRRLVARQLSEARASYDAALKREELAETAETYARSQLDLVSAAYRNGMANETDYDNAHAAFVRATLERSAAAVSTKIAEIHIEYVLGIPYGGGSDE